MVRISGKSAVQASTNIPASLPVKQIQKPSNLITETTSKLPLNHQIHSLHQFQNNNYTCNRCNLTFLTPISLLQHLDMYIAPIGCANCSNKFSDSLELAKHLCPSATNEQNSHRCPKCSKMYTDILTHIHEHAATHFNCVLCSQQFSSKDLITTHLATHKSHTFVNCVLCRTVFLNNIDLENHIYLKHICRHAAQTVPKSITITPNSIQQNKTIVASMKIAQINEGNADTPNVPIPTIRLRHGKTKTKRVRHKTICEDVIDLDSDMETSFDTEVLSNTVIPSTTISKVTVPVTAKVNSSVSAEVNVPVTVEVNSPVTAEINVPVAVEVNSSVSVQVNEPVEVQANEPKSNREGETTTLVANETNTLLVHSALTVEPSCKEMEVNSIMSSNYLNLKNKVPSIRLCLVPVLKKLSTDEMRVLSIQSSESSLISTTNTLLNDKLKNRGINETNNRSMRPELLPHNRRKEKKRKKLENLKKNRRVQENLSNFKKKGLLSLKLLTDKKEVSHKNISPSLVLRKLLFTNVPEITTSQNINSKKTMEEMKTNIKTEQEQVAEQEQKTNQKLPQKKRSIMNQSPIELTISKNTEEKWSAGIVQNKKLALNIKRVKTKPTKQTE